VSVYPLAYLKTTLPNFNNFLCILHVAVPRSSSDGVYNTLCTSVFLDDVIFHTVHGSIYGRSRVIPKRRQHNSQNTASIRTKLCVTIKMQHVHDVRCTLGAKSVIYDCLVSFRQPKLIVERRVIAKVVRQSYKRSIVMSMFVCLSVCLCLFVCLSVRAHISCTARPTSPNFRCMLIVAAARSSSGGVAIRYARTSGFVDDVIFFYNGPYGGVMLPQQRRCNVGRGLTRHPCCVVLFASCPRRQWASRLDEFIV